MLQIAVYGMLQPILQATQPVPVPVCFTVAWLLVGLTVWSSIRAVRAVVSQASKMHQVPCTSCQFLTGTTCLKCTVHPTIALTEAAISCPDYRSVNPYDHLVISESDSIRIKGV